MSAAFWNSQAGLLLSCRGGDAAAKKIYANSAYSEPGKPKALDPGDDNLQPIVFWGHVAPIVAMRYWAWRWAVNGCEFSSTIQQHSALHSSHLL